MPKQKIKKRIKATFPFSHRETLYANGNLDLSSSIENRLLTNKKAKSIKKDPEQVKAWIEQTLILQTTPFIN